MTHVVGLSGGKDSTAMALRLAQVEPRNYEYVCNETGNELPEMRAHWRLLEKLLGKPIKRVRYELDLVGSIRQQKMLPSVFARWCTRLLKIEPTIEYFEQLPANSVLCVGIRADEEDRRGLMGGCFQVDFPLRRWGWREADVWRYLSEVGVEIPARTDCAWCPYQRLGEWRDLYFKHPDIYQEGVALERELGATFRSPRRDTWPAGLKELSVDFDNGRKLREFKKGDRCRVCSL